jgi:hypothetical protein
MGKIVAELTTTVKRIIAQLATFFLAIKFLWEYKKKARQRGRALEAI